MLVSIASRSSWQKGEDEALLESIRKRDYVKHHETIIEKTEAFLFSAANCLCFFF